MGKRRRPSKTPGAPPRKKLKLHAPADAHPVLSRYYPRVVPLRRFLLDALPATSKKRRAVLQQLAASRPAPSVASWLEPARQLQLAHLLDSVHVGLSHPQQQHDPQARDTALDRDWRHFSQQRSPSPTCSPLDSSGVPYAEVVDFAVYLLFYRVHAGAYRPPHVLCHGLQRPQSSGRHGRAAPFGLEQTAPNQYRDTVKTDLWRDLFRLVGRIGYAVAVELFVRCAVFLPVAGSPRGALVQLSGIPIADLPLLGEQAKETKQTLSKPRKPSEIRFVRHRMLYSRPGLDSQGRLILGLRHIHVFNRYTDTTKPQHARHVLKYLFPRQFGLHNVFTSAVDATQTSQPFQEYTLREKEIESARWKANLKKTQGEPQQDPVPKRLRGEAMELVVRLQRRHSACLYRLHLDHYCPYPAHVLDPTAKFSSPSDAPHFALLATPVHQVAAFCSAVVKAVIPGGFFGRGEDGEANLQTLLKKIELFVSARRFETFSLEQMMRGIKTSCMSWTGTTSNHDQTQPLAMSDFRKRQELLAELVYYLFDSLVVPLIRFNFHVTEAGSNRNRLYFFRHDVWRQLTEPKIHELKSTMYEEIGNQRVLDAQSGRRLGYSQFRLLPKEKGMRVVANLRRKPQRIVGGRTQLGKSINVVLRPALRIFDCEKQHQPDMLQGSLFSVGGILDKLQAFRGTLSGASKSPAEQLYFVKVDVKACFDNLSQAKLVQLVDRLLQADAYQLCRNSEVVPGDMAGEAKPSRRFTTVAVRHGSNYTMTEQAQQQRGKRHHVLTDNVVPQVMGRDEVLQLAREHIEHNVVRVGKKYYRQQRGIAQGSVLSSFLCSLLFADFERRRLPGLQSGPSVLLRMIDDFLLVTTERGIALDFLQVMQWGDAEYGLHIKRDKTLINFDATVDGRRVERTGPGARFPFCGVLIDPASLDIFKDGGRFSEGETAEALTVEYSRAPGRTFQTKMANQLQMHLRALLLDGRHNSRGAIRANVGQILYEGAARAKSYLDAIRGRGREADLVPELVERFAQLTCAVLRRSQRGRQSALRRRAVDRLVVTAFLRVWRRRRRAGGAADWLARRLCQLRHRDGPLGDPAISW